MPIAARRAIVCNAKEAGFFVSMPLTDEKSVDEAGRALLAHFGCSAVLITRGEKGMSLFEESSPHHLHIPATSFEVTYARVGQPGVERGATGRQVFDVTGAGDTVLSVLALAAAAGASLPDAAPLANTAAGVVVGKLGTATVSPQELLHALDEAVASAYSAVAEVRDRCHGTPATSPGRLLHGGNVNDLSFDTTHTATTRVLRLCSACAGSSGLGIGENALIATAICTAFEPCGESSRMIL